MNLIKVAAISSVFLLSACTEANDKDEVNSNQVTQADSAEKHKVCDASVLLLSTPKKTSNEHQLSSSVSMTVEQMIAQRTFGNAKLATNVMCQELVGTQYTGSEEEWQGFFQQAVASLGRKGVKNLQLTIIGTGSKAYNGTLDNREYRFKGDFEQGTQVIVNLALLDKLNNKIYTISVSGDHILENRILEEYNRVVTSIILD